VSPNELHPKDSAIFWTGSGICSTRVLNITQKRGLDGNMTNCLKFDKRQKWVNHLFEQNRITSLKQYNEKRMKKLKEIFPKTLTNEKGGHTNSDRNNKHISKQKMEEPQKRKIHGTKIILPKQLKFKLKQLGPTDYLSIPT
jgi:hypothetical protein